MSAGEITDRRPRVLLGVSGGIAAFKAADLVRRLGDRGFEVRCALTRSAEAFIPALTLEVLSGHAVYRQEYMTATGSGEESHITAAQWADVLCIAPATAHTLARLALGLADDFLTTTVLAFAGPVVIAPAMHSEMWNKEVLQDHVATLKRRGHTFVGPVSGPLASGELGMGRLAEPMAIVDQVARSSARSRPGNSPLAGRRVLISAGPTYEPIDAVRFLGNRSSGKMGFALAAAAASRGARTTLVAGPVALPTPPGVERIDVETARQMRDAVYRRAPAAELIVMTAAVADFRPIERVDHKLKKEEGIPRLALMENPDILAGLPALAPRALRVGFAAETTGAGASNSAADEARAKLARKDVDFLVWNDVSRSEIGFGADDNEVVVYRRDGEAQAISRRPKAQLADQLLDLFSEALKDHEHAVAGPVG